MPPLPITSEQYVSRRLGELIQEDGEISEFQLRRLLEELHKVPDPLRRDCLVTTLHGLAGQYAEARRLADAYAAMEPARLLAKSRRAVIDVAAALHAAQRFKASAKLLRYSLKHNLLNESDGILAIQVATGVCAFNLAGEIMDRIPIPEDLADEYRGSETVARKVQELCLEDEHVQGYVQACVEAVLPWMEGGRRSLSQTHMVIEQSNQIVIDLEVPADPDDFGDIMWAIACINKAAYSQGVADHVLVDAVPVEEGAP